MGLFDRTYRVYSFRNDVKAVRKNRIPQRIVRKAVMKKVGKLWR